MFFQWYFLLFTGITVVTLWTYANNVWVLTQQIKGEKGERTSFLTDEMPPWLRRLSKAGLVAGAITFVLVMAHFFTDIINGRKWRSERGQLYQWAPSKRQDMILWIIAMPGIFTAMSVQSTARMWMVIDKTYGTYGKAVDLALYQENLDLAAATQFYVVFVFGRLCWQFIKERSSEETQTIVKNAGFQGVNAWVILGIFRSVFDFGYNYANAHPELWPHGFNLTTYQPELNKVCQKLEDYFTFATILCVYNMFLICKFKDVVDALGNANLKFTGMRLLIIIAQIQPQVVQMKLVMHTLNLIKEDTEEETLHNKNLMKLLHSTLLTFECLFVVLFNYFTWENEELTKYIGGAVKKELLYDARDKAEREADNENNALNQPLLGNDKEDDDA